MKDMRVLKGEDYNREVMKKAGETREGRRRRKGGREGGSGERMAMILHLDVWPFSRGHVL